MGLSITVKYLPIYCESNIKLLRWVKLYYQIYVHLYGIGIGTYHQPVRNERVHATALLEERWFARSFWNTALFNQRFVLNFCIFAFYGFFDNKYNNCLYWSCEDVCDILPFLLDSSFIKFGNDMYKQVTGIPMGANYAPLVADLFLFCYESEFI